MSARAGPRELESPVGQVHFVVNGLDVFEEIRRDLESLLQRGAVADEERAGFDRLVEPLVRVERDRVGKPDSVESCPAPLAEACERTVCAVYVQPDPVLTTERRQLADRVDGADRGGARVCDDDQRDQPVRPVRSDRGAQGVDPDPRLLVGWDHPHTVRPESERPRCPRDRGVGLVRHIGDGVRVHRPESRLTRECECGQVGRGPAGDEQSRCALRIADPVPEPIDHSQLERARPRGAEPPAGVEVERAPDQVTERAGPRSLAGDEREVTRMADPGDEGQDVAFELLEDPLEGNRSLGRAT